MVVLDHGGDAVVVGGHGAHVRGGQPAEGGAREPAVLAQQLVEHLGRGQGVGVRGRARGRVRGRGRARARVRGRGRVRGRVRVGVGVKARVLVILALALPLARPHTLMTLSCAAEMSCRSVTSRQ